MASTDLPPNIEPMMQAPPNPNRVFLVEMPRPNNQVHNIPPPKKINTKTSFMIIRSPARATVAPMPPPYNAPVPVHNWPVQPISVTTAANIQNEQTGNFESSC
jgi:hypothetical protein